MPNVTVTNTNASPISVLGLGRVQPNAVKSGYIEEAQYATHAHHYSTRGANVGVVVQEQGGPTPSAVEYFTGAGTIADTTKVALATAASANYALALPAAGDVPAGQPLNVRHTSGAYSVSLTPASGDTAGSSAVTYDLAATPADPSPGFAITLTTTITRTDGGSWLAEGYVQGGRIVIQDPEDVGNAGSFLIATVSESVITTTGLTNNAADTTIHFGVDNRTVLTASNKVARFVSDGVSAWVPA